jgi:hypothetical protein
MNVKKATPGIDVDDQWPMTHDPWLMTND